MPSTDANDVAMVFCRRQEEDDGLLLVWYRLLAGIGVCGTVELALSNALILVALQKDTSLHPPSKCLLRSLTLSDFCVGLFALPAVSVGLMVALTEQMKLCRFAVSVMFVTSTTFSGVALGTLCSISVDRLLALTLGLRYRQIVTLKRVRLIVILLWVKSATVGLLYVWSMNVFLVVSSVLLSFEVGIPTYSYTKIFRIIRHQQAQVRNNLNHENPNKGLAQNMAKYKKTVASALWVHLTMATCYLPFGVVATLMYFHSFSQFSLTVALTSTVPLIYLNSELNPGLYYWKITEVRKAVKELIKQFCPCSSNLVHS